jgi:hypothetical protein
VLKSIAHEYNLTQDDIASLKDAYMAIPRGRIQKEFDLKSGAYTGRYIVFHGDDIPINLIKNFVYQDFGLSPLASANKVIWQEEDHEKMSKKDKELFFKTIDKKKTKKKKSS